MLLPLGTAQSLRTWRAVPAEPRPFTLTVALHLSPAGCQATALGRATLQPLPSLRRRRALDPGLIQAGFCGGVRERRFLFGCSGRRREIMVLEEPWAGLSGVSGAALACCFVAAALALRWSSRRTARASAVRARRRQKAGLGTMDKAAQRFRLQVTPGLESVWRGRGRGGSSAVSRPGARRGGRPAAQVCGQRRFVTF